LSLPKQPAINFIERAIHHFKWIRERRSGLRCCACYNSKESRFNYENNVLAAFFEVPDNALIVQIIPETMMVYGPFSPILPLL
jgi:hypothetical protein